MSLQKLRSSQAGVLTRYVNKGLNGMQESRSRKHLSECIENISTALATLEQTNDVYIQQLTEARDMKEARDWFDPRKETAERVISELARKCKDKHLPSVTRTSVVDDSSGEVSSVATSSSKMSVKDKQQLILDTQLAQLELKQAQRRLKVSKEEFKRKQASEELKLQEELERAAVRATTLQDFVKNSVHGDDNVSNSCHENPVFLPAATCNKDKVIEQWLEYGEVQGSANVNSANVAPTIFNPSALAWQPLEPIDAWIDKLVPGKGTALDFSNDHADNNAIYATLVRLESEKDLPAIALPKFDGSPCMWPKFIERFHDLVHTKRGISDTRRMDILQSHLTGDAKNLVESIGYSGSLYAIVLQELKHYFGHRNKVARAFIDKLVSGSVIPARNPAALRKFLVTVRDCVITLKKLQYTADLAGTDILFRASKRIPVDRTGQWNKYISRIVQNREPSLFDLQKWLEDCVSAEFNPYALRSDRNQSTTKVNDQGSSSTLQEWKEKRTVLHTTTNVDDQKSNSKTVAECKAVNTTTSGSSACVLCSENHVFLYKCPQFSNKSPEERRKLAQTHKLCFNCLKPRHVVKDCKSTVRCRESECGRKHHTLLHDKSRVAKVNSTFKTASNSEPDCKSRAYFQLVRVLVSNSNGITVPTVALLDSASEITIVQESLAKELGVKGHRKPLTLKTMNSDSVCDSRVMSLTVKPADQPGAVGIHIKEVWSVNSREFQCPSQRVNQEWEQVKGLGISDIKSQEVGILIGINVPEAHIQLERRVGIRDQPLAVRTMLGWSLMGVAGVERNDEIEVKVNKTVVAHDTQLNKQIEKFWLTESFGCAYNHSSPVSTEDRKALRTLDNGTTLVKGHYQVPMLWKAKHVQLPNNRVVAERRFHLLEKRLNRDPASKKLYSDTLNGYVNKGFARKLAKHEAEMLSPKTWYIPHFGVTNVNKPGKIRVVFDAAATYMGTSLNSALLTGPDLLNSLFGILQRFRLYAVALAADVEAMFHQVLVSEEDSEALRFLWKEDLNKPGPPDVYKMTVHIFGAKDSPTCANYAMQRTARDNADKYSDQAVQTLTHGFYVDDLAKSVESVENAISLSSELRSLLAEGGFRLCKWVSNRLEVLNAIAKSELAVQEFDWAAREFPVQRTLGLKWNAQEDAFVFSCMPKETNLTKRGVVSISSAIFDPCGYLAPFIIRAKFFIQELWRSGVNWDDYLSPEQEVKWKEWLSELKDLQCFRLPRHHLNFTSWVTDLTIHVFSDASERGFGAVAYMRYVPKAGQNTCSILAARSHVAPIKPVLSIPRLELQGALSAVRLGVTLMKELRTLNIKVKYWTDSTTVLRYIRNESKRFKPFVANRVSEIVEFSDPEQWNYVPTTLNPADCLTRGLKASELMSSNWLLGPGFLIGEPESWPSIEILTSAKQDTDVDLEYKEENSGKHVLSTCTTPDSMHAPVVVRSVIDPDKYSSWMKLVRRTAWILRAERNMIASIRPEVEHIQQTDLTAAEFEEATLALVRLAQNEVFQDDINCLKNGEPVSRKSKIAPLCPVYATDTHCLRVGGRLRKANVPLETKYQLILPADHCVTRLIAADIHSRNAHCGREHLVSEMRKKYWPIRARIVSKRVINECRKCRRQKAKPVVVKMADLPGFRLSVESGPFDKTGVDYFGPMLVKCKRSTVKRWGCLFTCLVTRAVYIELADSLETDDFLLCMRNFIGRRGAPSAIYSDNGSNFIGANCELKQCLEKLNQSQISDFLAPQGIQWNFNPPQAPHFGGVWEILVKSTKKALKAVLSNALVKDSVLRTALVEVESVLNGRPLTYNSADPDDYCALTPNHFLIGRANRNTVPALVEDGEIDSRKRWRQAQVIANHVCKRWRKEYLPTLTIRHRWLRDGPVVKVGDLVLLVNENLPRGQWELARIVSVYPGDDGVVRTVKVKTPRNTYVRPVTKVCLLEENVSFAKSS